MCLLAGNVCQQVAKTGKLINFSKSCPIHVLYLLTPPHTSSHLITPSHTSSHLLTPPHTSSHLNTPLTPAHKFSRLLTLPTPNSSQSTAKNRRKDIKQQTRHQQTVQSSLKHVQDSWRVSSSMYVCALGSKLVHDSRRPERHSSPPEETPASEERSRISHLTQSHRTPQTSRLRMSNLTLHDSSQPGKNSSQPRKDCRQPTNVS